MRFAAETHGPGEGEVLVRVERFAFTANNVTYAQLGETLRYWEFWPAPDGWGRVPVWGFGDVLESRHPQVPAGERLYGFWPMSTHALLRPGRVAGDSLFEGSAHRRALPVVYNLYVRGGERGHEDLECLFRPLFGTSFLLDDFLRENGFFGAKRVLLLSASGKTAFGLANELHRKKAVEVVGVTSARNVAFVERLGCYDRVVGYDAIDALPLEPMLYVDFAGNSALREKIHSRFGPELKYGRKRVEALGREAYEERYAGAWRAFLPAAGRAVSIVRGNGPAAVGRVYAEALAGRVPPDRGNILSLHA